MAENRPTIIDASQCEWRTGVEHCGNYECMLNKCCDYNCDWYKRRKLEQQLANKTQECEELKLQLTSLSYADTICALEIDLEHKTQECEELKKANKKLMDIEEIIAPYNIPTKKVCENCIQYVPGSGVCTKDLPQINYTTSQTKACEAFCYTDELIPNILANRIKDVLDNKQ